MGLICPLGSWDGWYFYEEFKFAAANGYSIKIIEGYIFEKSNIFRDYVTDFYELKASAKDSVHKNIAKLLLNSLYGIF